MHTALRFNTTVLPGGKIQFESPELVSGEEIEVIILLKKPIAARRSAVDILAEASGQRVFKTAEDVVAYLREERESWDNLILPQDGLVYLETDAIIYSVEKVHPYTSILQPLWNVAQQGIYDDFLEPLNR